MDEREQLEETLSIKRIEILSNERANLVNKISEYQIPEDELLLKSYRQLKEAFTEAIVTEARFLASLK